MWKPVYGWVFLKELIWTVITLMVVYAILYPITQKIDYIYYNANAAFIFVTLTYFRWAVTLRRTLFLRPAWVRFLLFSFNCILFVFFMQQEQKFLLLHQNFFIEDFGFPKVIMFDNLKEDLFKYLYTQIVLFGTGSLLMIVALNIRLLISWWQFYKARAGSMLVE